MADNTTARTRKKKKKIKHPLRLIITVYILILVLVIGIVYVYPWVKDQTADVMTAEYGDLNSSQKQTFYFVKYETIYLAGKSGKAGYSYGEGDMARTGSTALEIEKSKDKDDTDYSTLNERLGSFVSGESSFLGTMDDSEKEEQVQKLREQEQASENASEKLQLGLAADSLENAGAPGSVSSSDSEKALKKNVKKAGISGSYDVSASGAVSYELDGYETALSPYTMEYLSRSSIENLESGSTDLFDGTVTKGEPVFKVVNNREWYAVTWVDNDDIGKYSEGAAVTLKLDDGDVAGTVSRIRKQGNENLVILKFTSYYKDIATLRTEKCRIVTSDERGLVIDNSFITERDGQKGVWVVDVTGKETFTRIKVIVTDGDASLVEAGTFTDSDGEPVSTVNVNDQIKKVS